MKSIRVPGDFVPTERFGAEATHWIEWIEVSGRPVVVTRKGKAVAVLVSPDDYFGIGDNLGVLRGLAAEVARTVTLPKVLPGPLPDMATDMAKKGRKGRAFRRPTRRAGGRAGKKAR
jgi:PHD/YefM family antitoxin component YafN of YafNO toxin-antitoxin module